MHAGKFASDDLMRQAVRALQQGDTASLAALDDLPVPIYATDAHGVVSYYNAACIAFAGRTPDLGKDTWCVTWKLYSDDGEALSHDQCPMAIAVREQRPVRDVEAMAERPGGTYVQFAPYPTPLFGEDGSFAGAANILIDVTDRKRAIFLATQAERC